MYSNFRRIALKAFLACEKRDSEASYRNICRWFSREFSTPLKAVEGYGEEYVFGTYIEDLYWRLHESEDEKVKQELARIRDFLVKDEEEIKQEEEDDEAFVRALEERYGALVSDAARDAVKNATKPNLSQEIAEHKDVFLTGESGPPEE